MAPNSVNLRTSESSLEQLFQRLVELGWGGPGETGGAIWGVYEHYGCCLALVEAALGDDAEVRLVGIPTLGVAKQQVIEQFAGAPRLAPTEAKFEANRSRAVAGDGGQGRRC